MSELTSPSSAQLKRFRCGVCKISFAKNEHLVRHVRSHTKERPFKCPDCGNRYTRQDILVRHRRDVRCRRQRKDRSNTEKERIDPDPNPNSMARTVTSQEPDSPLSIHPQTEIRPAATTNSVDNIENTRTDGMVLESLNNDVNWIESLDVNPISSLLPGDNTAEDDLFQFDNCGLGGHDSRWEINDRLRDEFSMLYPASVYHENLFTSDVIDNEITHVQNVGHLWHTCISEMSVAATVPKPRIKRTSGAPSPDTPTTAINEGHRQSIRDRLQIIAYEPTVPSSDILSVGLHLFFTKVHGIFPLVHVPTFQPCRQNTNLVIAMCAIGGLFTGSDHALEQGIYLFGRVHKATLHNWEQLLSKGAEDLITIIQSVLISQLFALLSGVPKLLLTVDAFHGPPIAWARYLHQYRRPPVTSLNLDVEDCVLETLWQEWARNEELLRIAHGLYILDVELSSLLHHELIQSYEAYRLSFTSSEKVFSACNPQEWKRAYVSDVDQQRINPWHPDPSTSPLGSLHPRLLPKASSFTANVLLQNISVRVLQQKANRERTENCIETVHQSLDDLHPHLIPTTSSWRDVQSKQEGLQLHIFRSLIYMESLADFDFLEHVIGRDGSQLTAKEDDSITKWANSVDAYRCVVHVLILKRQVEAMDVASEPALHVPRTLFWAAIALFCYIRYAARNQPVQNIQSFAKLDFPEICSMGIASESLPTRINPQEITNVLFLKVNFFSIIDLLQHTGHWGISRRFAAILTALGNFAFHQPG